MHNNRILVSICCITYNHEEYIKQCLEGFLMQETTFEIEILIHDDASTDKTTDIIKEYEAKYPELVKPIYQTENQYSKGVRPINKFNFERAKGKYLALCEGDDYWIDPLKLQKQVSFLESNQDYGLVHTGYKTSNGGIVKNQNYNKTGYYLEDFLVGRRTIGTLTMIFRRDLYEKIPKYYLNKKFKIGDLPLRIEMAKEMKFKYINECTAMYNVLDESASHSNRIEHVIDFQKETLLIRLFYIKKFQFQKLRRKSFQTYYSVVIKMAYEKNNQFFSNLYFKKLCRIGFPNFKTTIFYFGTKYALFNKFIHFINNKSIKHV